MLNLSSMEMDGEEGGNDGYSTAFNTEQSFLANDDYLTTAEDYVYAISRNNDSENYSNDDSVYLNISYYQFRHSNVATGIYICAYALVFVLGLVGNFLVIQVVFRVPRMRTVTNLFIANLAVADLLVICFCMPATLMSNLFVPWIMGWFMCKTVPYVQGVSVAASVYSLCAVSIDRFMAIWWPLKKQITKKRAKAMMIGIWTFALILTSPWLIYFELTPMFPSRPDIEMCFEIWPQHEWFNETSFFIVANLCMRFLIPTILIFVCYTLIWIKVSYREIPGETTTKDSQKDRIQQQSKMKVIKMLASVVIVFVISWLPLYITFTIIKFGRAFSTRHEEFFILFTPIAQWLGSANSSINPLLYSFNDKYRRGFKAIWASRKCWGRLRYYETVAISTSSTRKSSHYNKYNSTREAPCSPSIKSDAVSFIYDQSNMNNRKHAGLSKQNSNLSRQILLKQDSSVSVQSTRQILANNQNKSDHMTDYLVRQDSSNSCKALIKQDSNGSILSKQNSQVSYCESKRSFSSSIDSCTDLRKESILRQNFQNAYMEQKRKTLSKQDTEISLIEENRPSSSLINSQDSCTSLISTSSATRRQRLVKQDSIFSFGEPIRTAADYRRREFTKQDSVVSVSFADHHEII